MASHTVRADDVFAYLVFAFRYENPEPEPAAPEPVVDPKAKKK
jgi:hypothetical protein